MLYFYAHYLFLSCSNSEIRSAQLEYPVFFEFISDLLTRLERLRGSEKTVGEVGPTLMNWVSIWRKINLQLLWFSFLILTSSKLCLHVFIFLPPDFTFSLLRTRPMFLCSFLASRRMLHTAVTRWEPKLCWTRRSTRKEWSTFCVCVRSPRSAGNWTCGTSWISLGAVWSSTLCCWRRYRSALRQTTPMKTRCRTLWVGLLHNHLHLQACERNHSLISARSAAAKYWSPRYQDGCKAFKYKASLLLHQML